jgi:hypothetical protein
MKKNKTLIILSSINLMFETVIIRITITVTIIIIITITKIITIIVIVIVTIIICSQKKLQIY